MFLFLNSFIILSCIVSIISMIIRSQAKCSQTVIELSINKK